MSASIVVPDGWFEGPEGEKALDRAHAYGVSWQREGEEVFGPAYLLEAVAAIRRLREVRSLPDRETIARALHDAVTAKARAERANVAQWEGISSFHRNGFLVMADAVLALFGQEAQR